MKRAKTPTVIQMEMAECGAASLAIILGYFGKFVTLEELRIRCGVSRDGSNLPNLLKAATSYGLESQPMHAEVSALDQVECPAILFWGFNHFLVLEGVAKNFIYINDPNTGPRKITWEELDREYTGVAVSFKPGPDFKPAGKPASMLQALYSRVKNFRQQLLFIILAGIGLLLPGLALPTLIRIFVDNVIISQIRTWEVGIILALIFTMLVTGILTFLQRHVLNRLQQKMSILFSSQFLWHILRLPMSFYGQRFAGEIAYRMSLNHSVAEIITGSLATTLIDLMLIIFYAIIMMQYSILIASIGIIGALVNLAAMIAINRSRQNSFACLQQDLGKSVGVSIGALQSIETVKAMGAESDFFSRWVGYYTKTVNANQDISKKDAYLSSAPVLGEVLVNAFVLGIGAWKVLQGELTVGMLMALQALMFTFMLPIARFVDFGMLIQNLKITLGRLDDVLENPIDSSYTSHVSKAHEKTNFPLKLDGHLEFKNVTFGYSPLAEPLLNEFSFKLAPGERIALVGPSGCGKSTVAKLASCLQRPWKGEIYFDGKNYDHIPRELFNRSIALVDQEIFLFEGSIRDNLTLWDSTASEKAMIQACKDACIHKEIIMHDKGYDALLAEKGKNLSGGQRQRLEIARALLGDPTILILDEATSALDSETEKTIINNIYRRGCTCVMIAHRLSTIRECDEIIVLNHGKIAQRGSHDELKEMEGLYRDLVRKEGFENE